MRSIFNIILFYAQKSLTFFSFLSYSARFFNAICTAKA